MEEGEPIYEIQPDSIMICRKREYDGNNFVDIISSKVAKIDKNSSEKKTKKSSSIKTLDIHNSSDESSTEDNNNDEGLKSSACRPTRKGRFVKGTNILATLKEARGKREGCNNGGKKKTTKKDMGNDKLSGGHFDMFLSVPDVKLCSLTEEIYATKSLSSKKTTSLSTTTDTLTGPSIYKSEQCKAETPTRLMSDDDCLSPEIAIQSIERVPAAILLPQHTQQISTWEPPYDEPYLDKGPLLWAIDNMNAQLCDTKLNWPTKVKEILFKWASLPSELQTHYTELAQGYKHGPKENAILSTASSQQNAISCTSATTATTAVASSGFTSLKDQLYKSSINTTKSHSPSMVIFNTTQPSTIPYDGISNIVKPNTSNILSSILIANSSSSPHYINSKLSTTLDSQVSSAQPAVNKHSHIAPSSKHTTNSSKLSTTTNAKGKGKESFNPRSVFHVSEEWKQTLKAKVKELTKKSQETSKPTTIATTTTTTTMKASLKDKESPIRGCSNKLTRPPMKAKSPQLLQSLPLESPSTPQDNQSFATLLSNLQSSNILPAAGNSFVLTDALNYAELEKQFKYAQTMLENQYLYVETLKSRLVRARMQQQIIFLNSEHYRLFSKKVVLPPLDDKTMDGIPISVAGYRSEWYRSLNNKLKGSFDKPILEDTDFYNSLNDSH